MSSNKLFEEQWHPLGQRSDILRLKLDRLKAERPVKIIERPTFTRDEDIRPTTTRTEPVLGFDDRIDNAVFECRNDTKDRSDYLDGASSSIYDPFTISPVGDVDSTLDMTIKTLLALQQKRAAIAPHGTDHDEAYHAELLRILHITEGKIAPPKLNEQVATMSPLLVDRLYCEKLAFDALNELEAIKIKYDHHKRDAHVGRSTHYKFSAVIEALDQRIIAHIDNNEEYKKPLSDVDWIPNRSGFLKEGLKTLGDLAKLNMLDMLKVSGVGQTRAEAIAEGFDKRGMLHRGGLDAFEPTKPYGYRAGRAIDYEEVTRLREEPNYRWDVPKLLCESEMAGDFTNELVFELNYQGHTWINWGRKPEGDDVNTQLITTENSDA